MSKKSLGRGLEALIRVTGEQGDISSVSEIPIETLKPNPYQPRKDFSEESLKELADSIRQKGILQPILVEASDGGTYIIVAGERRFRAAKIAGLKKIPVIVKRFSEEEKIEIALIENIQREDLSPIEEAYAFKRLIDISKLSQEEIAEKVGKKRSTIANSLRLLKLPEIVRNALNGREISPGHARAILMLDKEHEQLALFRKIIREELSVRSAEKIASEMKMGKGRPSEDIERKEKRVPQKSADILEVEKNLIERLGTKVVIRGNENRGKIEISYFSLDDLNRILEIFSS